MGKQPGPEASDNTSHHRILSFELQPSSPTHLPRVGGNRRGGAPTAASSHFSSLNNTLPSVTCVLWKIKTLTGVAATGGGEASRVASLPGEKLAATFPVSAAKAAHLPMKLMTAEIPLITERRRTRLTFAFQITDGALLRRSQYKRVSLQEQMKSHRAGVKGVARKQPLPAAWRCLWPVPHRGYTRCAAAEGRGVGASWSPAGFHLYVLSKTLRPLLNIPKPEFGRGALVEQVI